MSFERIAEETLADIVDYVGLLDGPDSVLSWRHLASVNRTLHRIVTPLLYEQFTEANSSSAPKLLRTVLSNPQLATGFRQYTGYGIPNPPPQEYGRVMDTLGNTSKFVLSAYQFMAAQTAGSFPEKKNFLDMSGFQEPDFVRCREMLKKIACPNQEDWMSDIRLGRWHAVTSMLLLLLTNLEDFEVIDYRDDVETGYFDLALGIAARLQKYAFMTNFALKHLTKVSLEACPEPQRNDNPFAVSWDTGYLYLTDIMPFLKLPSVQSISIRRLSVTEGCNHYPLDYDQSKDLKITTKELALYDSVLEMWELRFLLRKFTHLRKFSYEHVADRVDFLPQEIGAAIAHLKSCLEELEISSSVEENGYNEYPARIGSLAEFEKLKVIDLNGSDLLGYPSFGDGLMPNIRLCDILPRSLERLTVGSCDSSIKEEHLKGLLLAKGEKFPKLKRVKVQWRGIEDEEGLKRDFKANGVKFLL